MSVDITYLITGANRGIGLALTQILLSRPNTRVIGTVRKPSTSTSALRALPTAASSRLLIRALDFTSTAPGTLAQFLVELSLVGVTSVDVVIANAGIAQDFASAFSTRAAELRVHFDVNTLGPILLYQTLYGMLTGTDTDTDTDMNTETETETDHSQGPTAATATTATTAPHSKKFVLISSSLGSIGAMEEQEERGGAAPSLAYGISKAAANYFIRKVHFEEEAVVTLAVHPGWVRTGNGQVFADSVGVLEPPMGVEESARGVMEQIDKATKKTTSGSFVSYNGAVIPW
ncbi:hypothetical protein LZ554_003125 [Drepanopeziza brunnea f. sp. 'monogermtubi']|nr:hypothetical protein LZ554_003125 [Drepanopeziza brunnea f. sp. 'monogermtubi']